MPFFCGMIPEAGSATAAMYVSTCARRTRKTINENSRHHFHKQDPLSATSLPHLGHGQRCRQPWPASLDSTQRPAVQPRLDNLDAVKETCLYKTKAKTKKANKRTSGDESVSQVTRRHTIARDTHPCPCAPVQMVVDDPEKQSTDGSAHAENVILGCFRTRARDGRNDRRRVVFTSLVVVA